jgi:hypothetical protein
MQAKFLTGLTLAALLTALPAAVGAQTSSGDLDDVVNQNNTPFGATSAEFLLLGAGARGTALGGAFAALADDVSALYYNPAGAALIDRAGAMVSTYDYVAETRYSWVGLAFPFSGGARTFGLQFGTFGFSDQPVYTVAQPDGTGSLYSVSETFVGATYAENFSDRFSAGLTAKFIFDNLGDASGTAFAVDFGTNFHAMLNNHPVRFSFVLANLGSNISYGGDALISATPRVPLPGEDPVPSLPQPSELRSKSFPLPTTFRVGLAYDLVAATSTRLTVLGDFNQPTNNKAGFVFGGELAFNRLGGSGFGVDVRSSYSYTAANNIDPTTVATALNDEANLQGMAVGGGLNYGTDNGFSIGFDYAYKYMGVLGGTNFFTLEVGW